MLEKDIKVVKKRRISLPGEIGYIFMSFKDIMLWIMGGKYAEKEAF